MGHESDGDTDYNKWARYSQQKFSRGTGGLGNKRTSGDHTNYCITKIGQNTEKSPGYLRGIVCVTEVEDHQLILL